jgi:glyoxylase-like metal-dependent hydrolase (beta-lactamase superfamily II)
MSALDFTATTLHYPIDTPPPSGRYMPVAEGVYWLRMPLPIYLNHINLWLLEGEASFTIVDTGWATEENIAVWEYVASTLLHTKPVERIVVTHMHPDHIGLAGWLTDTHGVELCMSRAEYLNCHLILSYTHEQAPVDAIHFYKAAGYDDSQLQKYKAHFGKFGQFVRNIPHAYRRLQDNDILPLSGSDWQVVVGGGHSPEHVCLYNSKNNIFIAGDQLLPTISSNVSVWPTEPYANPMEEWLTACHKLSTLLNEDTLVLPSHGLPFYGATQRLQLLIEESETSLQQLAEHCNTPRRAVDTFEVLFKSPITNSNLQMATGESLAHLHCLKERGILQVERREGVDYWSRV